MDIPWQHPGIARSMDSDIMVLLERTDLENTPVYGTKWHKGYWEGNSRFRYASYP